MMSATARTAARSPKGHWLLGHMPDFSRDSLGFVLSAREYGDLVRLRFGPFGAWMVNHPDYIHQVLVEDADKYYKTRVTKRVMYPVVGQGLFTNDGESWKRQRRLVQPAFHTKRIGAYADVMVQYAQERMNRWRDGQVLMIDHEMTELTMSIIAKTLFDADVSAEASEVSDVITEVLALMNERFNHLILPPDWLPTRPNRRMKAAVARLDKLIQGFIDDRRRSGEDKGDLLSMLLLARDEDGTGQMTDKQVRDEAITLFGAGHETTANALTWTWYCLSQHPAVERKLHDELDSVVGGRAPRLEDLPNLRYTEMIIKEAMRLYPPAWGTSREAIVDHEIGGHLIKKGEVIFINIYGVHRDARFFPDPERFDPERFSAENEKKIPKYAYLPFGGGPRVCIGNAFAMMEARLILATMAQRYTFSVAPGHVVAPQRVFTLRARHGMKMIAHVRQDIPTAANFEPAAP